MKILIADDELRLRKVVVLHLRKNNFEVIEAGNGRQAVELALQNMPDVIVLDVVMPELDGIGALKEFRSMDKFKTTPIIMLTAMASEDDITKGLSSGANAYITKPFSPKELIDRINFLNNEPS